MFEEGQDLSAWRCDGCGQRNFFLQVAGSDGIDKLIDGRKAILKNKKGDSRIHRLPPEM
jgi:hypothetical protein